MIRLPLCRALRAGMLGSLTVLLLLSGVSHAERSSFRAYQLPKHGLLQLAVPASWGDQIRQRQKDAPPTIRFVPEQGDSFNVQITPAWPTQADAGVPDKAELKRAVSQAANAAKPHAAEADIPIQEMVGSSGGSGYYFTVTDREARPGEYKYMTQGAFGVGELVLMFTILSNDGAEAAVADALNMVKLAQPRAEAKR